MQKLQDHPDIGYRVVGFLDDSQELENSSVADRPVLGTSRDLRDIIRDQQIEDEILERAEVGRVV